jgi:hypothetical protein
MTECVICLENLEDHTNLTLMCDHRLHDQCLYNMLNHTPPHLYSKCPICRKYIGGPNISNTPIDNNNYHMSRPFIILSIFNWLILVLFLTRLFF